MINDNQFQHGLSGEQIKEIETELYADEFYGKLSATKKVNCICRLLRKALTLTTQKQIIQSVLYCLSKVGILTNKQTFNNAVIFWNQSTIDNGIDMVQDEVF